MAAAELPLGGLFIALRAHGLPLGIDDYLAALQALRAGFGVGTHQDLELLCLTLWAKSASDARLVRQLLAKQLRRPAHDHYSSPPQGGGTPPPVAEVPPAVELSKVGPTPPPGPDLLDVRLAATEDPVQVAQAIRQEVVDDDPAGALARIVAGEYFPVTRRQMKQSWCRLRRPVREGPRVELDVAGTAVRAAYDGVLVEPLLVPRRTNVAQLVLLIDQDGSMVPFHALSRQLVETARRGGRLADTGTYYFHDCPLSHLYTDPARTQGRPVGEALTEAGARAVVLVVSDAGAARGRLDLRRVESTERFLRRHAWLNPMPNERWAGTTPVNWRGSCRC
jgi:hypothetical protein